MRSRNKDNETLNVHLDGTRCVTRFMKKKCVNIAYAYSCRPTTFYVPNTTSCRFILHETFRIVGLSLACLN